VVTNYTPIIASPNPLDVYKGRNSIPDYHDLAKAQLLLLVELTSHVNPHYARGVCIYAKMMNALPAHDVKVLPGNLRSLVRIFNVK
jgi:hypothetical protein